MYLYDTDTNKETVQGMLDSGKSFVAIGNLSDFGLHSNAGIKIPLYCIEVLESVYRLNKCLKHAGLTVLDSTPIHKLLKNAIEGEEYTEHDKEEFYSLVLSLNDWYERLSFVSNDLSLVPNYELLAYVAGLTKGRLFDYDWNNDNDYCDLVYSFITKEIDVTEFENECLNLLAKTNQK